MTAKIHHLPIDPNRLLATHLSHLVLSLISSLTDIVRSSFTTHPATVLPSHVIAQLGRAQRRVRCGSDFEAVRKDSGQMELTRLFLLRLTMLMKDARQFRPKLTRTSNRGMSDTCQTRPPLRLDHVVLKSIFSCDSASDHFNTFSLCGGADSEMIAGHLMKMCLDTPPNMHSPLRLHRQCSLTHINHRCVSAFSELWMLGGRSDDKLLLNDVHSFQPAIWTKTIEIDGEERDLLLVCAGLSETDQSILTIDRILLASEFSPDQNFVFTTPFSFAASAFPKNPIGVAACIVVVEDGIVSMGGLDGDELRPFWTYWKVSELALDSSDAKFEVQTASGRISSGSVALLGKQVFMFGGSVSEQLRTDPTRNHNRTLLSTLTDTFRCSLDSVVDSSATSSAGCSITPAGKLASKFGTTSPRLCSVGTTNRFEGSTRGYHCVSCRGGSLAGTDGS
ncbi:hypothetical protein BLNAU_18571 [Blattamonas nauphoetae]|uniref:Uncharacterized protein n=1 Tax=Blattamonas nauphoetae TaxID=2049346 RepID=A0ABQ9X435_9EUKA|nr:hypothetical protein BLNAU_18571 [Blattamonas nauphoetae]